MNPREAGFLLLSSHLGDPERKTLSRYQLRVLAERMQTMDCPAENRELAASDLTALGYSRDMAGRIVSLLRDETLLQYYLSRGRAEGCFPVTRVSENYPSLLRQRLGLDSPGCLWAKGDLGLLREPAISLVGSRDLRESNRIFAQTVGEMAARNGFVLVSGNARGADRAAQDACLASGGRVISIVADCLADHAQKQNVLYLSEDGYAEAFSAQRALSRNRCIHALGNLTFVAQCDLGSGGTWDGTVKNLRHGWSTVICFRDGSPASRELEQMGAYLLAGEELKDFSFSVPKQNSFFGE